MINLQNFSVDECTVQFWVIKGVSKTARIVNISDKLERSLKSIKPRCLSRFTQTFPYEAASVTPEDALGYLSGPIPQWDEIRQRIDGVIAPKVADSISKLKNTNFYAVKYSLINGSILYGIKKCSSDWAAAKSKEGFSAYWSGDTLENADDTIFSISKYFDFFVLNNKFYILDKKKFESILGYKDSYRLHFENLKSDPLFNANFINVDALVNYVGDNAVQLGRMSVALAKRKFADDDYLNSIKNASSNEDWGLEFSSDGKFIFTPENSRVMILVLLGHRVKSICGRETLDASGLSPIR